MGLQETFGECLIYIVIGQIFRQLILSKPGCKHYLNVLVTIVLQITLPAVLLRTLSNIKEFSPEGGAAIGMYLVFVPACGLIAWLLYRKKEPGLVACFVTSCMGENIGLFFYPIMQEVAGAEGVALLALLDFPGPFFAFGLFPAVYSWARKKQKQIEEQKKGVLDDHSEAIISIAPTPSMTPSASSTPDLHEEDVNHHHQQHQHHNEEKEDDKEHRHHHLHNHHDEATDGKQHEESTKKRNSDEEDDDSSSATSYNEEDEKDTYSDLEWDAISVVDVSDDEDDEEELNADIREAARHHEHRDQFSEYVLDVKRQKEKHDKRWRKCRKCSPGVRSVWNRVSRVLGLFTSMPLDSILIGVILGPIIGCGLPDFIEDFLQIAARGNTFASMVLCGALLDIHINALRTHWKSVLLVCLIRYGVGGIITIIGYFVVGPQFGPLASLVYAVGYLMPTPVASGSYAVKYNIDPGLPALAINVTMIISFFLTWGILACIPPLPSSSSSSSSSMNITMSL